MNKIALIATTVLIASTAGASAASVDDRQAYQAKRIEQGRQTGKITWREGLKLRAEQNRIANKEAAYRSDGYLSKSERRSLRYMQNEASNHISSEKSPACFRAYTGAICRMSYVRIRVASSDWCASRKVVSVTSRRGCSRTQWANFSGPSS